MFGQRPSLCTACTLLGHWMHIVVKPEGPGAVNEDLLKFLGPFELVKRQAKYGEMSPKWQPEEEEYLVEMGVDNDHLKRFAGGAGVEHLDRGELLTAMRVHELHKHPRANVKGQHFVSLLEELQKTLMVPEQKEQLENPVPGATLRKDDIAKLVTLPARALCALHHSNRALKGVDCAEIACKRSPSSLLITTRVPHTIYEIQTQHHMRPSQCSLYAGHATSACMKGGGGDL